MGYPHNSRDNDGWKRGARGIDTNDSASITKDWMCLTAVRNQFGRSWYLDCKGGDKVEPETPYNKIKPATPRQLVQSANPTGTDYVLGTGRSQSRGITHRTPDDTPTDGGRYHPRGFGATEHG